MYLDAAIKLNKGFLLLFYCIPCHLSHCFDIVIVLLLWTQDLFLTKDESTLLNLLVKLEGGGSEDLVPMCIMLSFANPMASAFTQEPLVKTFVNGFLKTQVYNVKGLLTLLKPSKGLLRQNSSLFSPCWLSFSKVIPLYA